jgi:aspartate carbamoyltransferase catalytic subunit
MRAKIYATRLGMIPSTEIAYRLRIDAERKRLLHEQEKVREQHAAKRSARRRELWARVREGLPVIGRAANA